MTPATSDLARIIELTDRVHAAIAAGDWAGARDLDIERRMRLEQLLAMQTRRDDTGELARVLSDLSSLTNRMIGEVEHHRRRVLREASTIKNGYAAVDSYAHEVGESP
jgi:hypothetical protein